MKLELLELSRGDAQLTADHTAEPTVSSYLDWCQKLRLTLNTTLKVPFHLASDPTVALLSLYLCPFDLLVYTTWIAQILSFKYKRKPAYFTLVRQFGAGDLTHSPAIETFCRRCNPAGPFSPHTFVSDLSQNRHQIQNSNKPAQSSRLH